MDIIKSIEQENLNPNAPKFEVGDSVRVYFKVIEGNKERVQAYEGIVIARAVLTKLLPYAAFPTVSALNVPSRYTAPRSKRSRSSVAVKSDARNFIICATVPVKLQRSKVQSIKKVKRLSKNSTVFLCRK